MHDDWVFWAFIGLAVVIVLWTLFSAWMAGQVLTQAEIDAAIRAVMP